MPTTKSTDVMPTMRNAANVETKSSQMECSLACPRQSQSEDPQRSSGARLHHSSAQHKSSLGESLVEAVNIEVLNNLTGGTALGIRRTARASASSSVLVADELAACATVKPRYHLYEQSSEPCVRHNNSTSNNYNSMPVCENLEMAQASLAPALLESSSDSSLKDPEQQQEQNGAQEPENGVVVEENGENRDDGDDGYNSNSNSATPTVSNSSLMCRSVLSARTKGGGLSLSRNNPHSVDMDVDDELGGGTSSSSSSSSSATPSPTPSATLGVNMRVTGQCSQGGRKYMEDQFSVAYQEAPGSRGLEYAFFGIYDGHGGAEAAVYAKEHLMLEIVQHKLFWSDNDEDVLRAIREGYIATHFAMWREQENWPRTPNGHLSTAGTTATVAFMRREKIYIGHVGDTAIVLGYQNHNEQIWRAKQLTTDHKPESLEERARIQRAGGNVTNKSGVPRVVWNRPRDPYHRGPIRHRTPVDDVPFLAVARSLGDLWSYNSRCNEFVVSPDPDVKVVRINPNTFRCLVFGTDGLWNVVSPQEAVNCVHEKHMLGESLHEQDEMNPSKALVEKALRNWSSKKMRADNTSVVTVILTPATSNDCRDEFTDCATAPSKVKNLCEASIEHMMIESCPMSTTLHIDEYKHELPYSALAKRYLPPEPYRNFNYYESDNEDEEVAEEAIFRKDLLARPHKFWLKTHQQRQEVRTSLPWEGNDEPVVNGNINDLPKVKSVHAAPEKISEMGNLVEDINTDDLDIEDLVDEESAQQVLIEEEEEEEEYLVEENTVAHLELINNELELYNTTTTTTFESSSGHTALLEGHSCSSRSSSGSGSELAELEQHLEHSFHSYNNASSGATDYSFAESYNTLLNEQQAARTRIAQAVQAAASPPATHLASSMGSLQEILQEQQRYQQQEGYSLTRLETRREQQQAAAAVAATNAAVATNTEWSDTSDEYLDAVDTVAQQPAELLALNALLQQERAEEQQVALEQEQRLLQQQQQEQQQQHELSYTPSQAAQDQARVEMTNQEPEIETEQHQLSELKQRSSTELKKGTLKRPKSNEELQLDVSVELKKPRQTYSASNTIPCVLATPTVRQFQETATKIRKEDACAVRYIFEQIQKLRDANCTPVSASPEVSSAIERATAAASELQLPMIDGSGSLTKVVTRRRRPTSPAVDIMPLARMRRYRNVPNENLHHSPLPHRRQKLKTRRAKNFNDSEQTNTASSSSLASCSPMAPVVAGSSTLISARRSNNLSNSNVNRVVGGGSVVTDSTMRTRRHQSASNAVENNRRQLRSSIFSSELLNTRTLRTRNAAITPTKPSPTQRSSSSTGSGSNSDNTNGTANGGTRSPKSYAKSVAAGATRAAALRSSSGGGRVQQTAPPSLAPRRNMRRSALNAASNTGANGNLTLNNFSKPTRLQANNAGSHLTRPPPSPKKLNGTPIGTRALTAALAAAAANAELTKRWTLRSAAAASATANSSALRPPSSLVANGNVGSGRLSQLNNSSSSLMRAITCYSARTRVQTRKR